MGLNVRNIRMVIYLVLMMVLFKLTKGQTDCSRLEYERCIQIADPLLKEAHLIFPDNMEDIDIVCRTWNRLVECLKDYTENCFTEQQRRQFNKAVENPIESVHQMCMQPNYQKEYLHYAPCLKSTITDRRHCGSQYNLLVDQVAQGDIISKSTLCCSHDRFKQCIQRETRRLCDRNYPNGPASRFSNQIIEKALSFLQEQCFNYIPNSGDCGVGTTDLINDPLTMTSSLTTSSEVYPWSTIQDIASKEIQSSKAIVKPPPPPPPPPTTTTTTTKQWLPSTTLEITSNGNTSPVLTSELGSRSRPASYGRANSWLSSSSSPLPPITNSPQTSSTTSPPSWINNWQPMTSTVSTDTWYPAAGNQLVNEVEEPNQQGLSKPKNNANILRTNHYIFGFFIIFSIFC